MALKNKKTDLEKPSNSQRVYKFILFVMVATFAVFYFQMVKIIPAFQDVFASFGAKLPWPTQVVIDASEFLRKPIGLFLFFSILGLAGFLIYGKTAKISPDQKPMFFLKVGAFFIAFLGLSITFIVWAIFLGMFEIGK